MPYPNEHACRIKPPGDFQQGSFRRIKRGSKTGARDGKQLSIIIGRPKGKTTTTTQAYRYPADAWTAEQARSHCKEEGGSFEAATGQKEMDYIVLGDDVFFAEDLAEFHSCVVSEVIRKEGDEIVLYDSEGEKVLQRFPFGEGKKYKDEETVREAAKKRERQIQFFKHRETDMEIDKVRTLLEQALSVLSEECAEGGEEEIVEAELSESTSGHSWTVAETGEITGGPRAPLLLDFALMKPGRGNKRDNHYYSREVLERDAHVFEGVKMYATDHRPEEKSVRTEVGIVKMCPIRFEDDGTPIGRASIFNPDFAEQVRNRAKAGVLDSLENSILGIGKTKPGEAPDGGKVKMVEAITKGLSVDFVTKGGAGGQARALIENDGGETMSEQDKEKGKKAEEASPQEAQTGEAVLAEQKQEQAREQEAPQTLAEAEVEKAVDATKLPAFVKTALKVREYKDEAELEEAVETATKEVAKLTGSGQPFAQGGGTAPGKEEMSEADYETAYAEILRRHGLHVPQRQEV
jgi:hypothetical protein